MKIILATTSPYRIEMMKNTGIPFEAKSSNVDEYFDDRPKKPQELVKLLSKLKAQAVAKDCVDSLVIGMDSVTYFQKTILEKPKSYDEAFKRLKAFSGKTHEFYTGITVINTNTHKTYQECVQSKATFRKITDSEIKKYLDEDPRHNTYALGYDPIKHISSSFIKEIIGDPFNLMQGIPLSRIVEIIYKMTGEK